MCHIIVQDIEKQRNAVIAGCDYALLVSFHVEGMLLLCLLLIVTTGSFLYASEFFATQQICRSLFTRSSLTLES